MLYQRKKFYMYNLRIEYTRKNLFTKYLTSFGKNLTKLKRLYTKSFSLEQEKKK